MPPPLSQASRPELFKELAEMSIPNVQDAAAFQSFIQTRGTILSALQTLISGGPPLTHEEQAWAQQAQRIASEVTLAAESHLQAIGNQLRSIQAAQRVANNPTSGYRGKLLNKRG